MYYPFLFQGPDSGFDLPVLGYLHLFTSEKEILKIEPHHEKTVPTFWFPTWSDTNQAVQLQKMDRCLKFRI